jgi:hypothetical protein
MPSPEDGSRSSFRNVVILDFRMMEKVQKPISSQFLAFVHMWLFSTYKYLQLLVPDTYQADTDMSA